MFIHTSGRRVVIVGDGEQAAQKAGLILKTDAQIILGATHPEPELWDLIMSNRIEFHQGAITPALFKGAAMGFIASGCPGIDASIHAIAQDAGCLVNVVEQPDLCDLTTPSLVDRDPVVVAIGTEGTAPVLARQIKTKVEELLDPNLGGLAALVGRLRGSVAQNIAREKRRDFWRRVFAETPRISWTRGAERAAAREIKAAVMAGGAPQSAQAGTISLIGAGPEAKDLLTLRAVARLQEAGVIFYDRLIEAAKAAGVAVEIGPGITAVCAAGAGAGISPTERGITDTLVLATATGAGGGVLPDSVRFTGLGTSTAFYMATRQAPAICRALSQQGLPPDAPITLAVEISKADEKIDDCTLSTLTEVIKAQGIAGCAIILFTWPKDIARAADRSPPRPRLVAAE